MPFTASAILEFATDQATPLAPSTMKFLIVLAATILATASAQTTPTPAPQPLCDTTKLFPLLQDPNLALCTADSGLSFPPKGAIGEATLAKACASAGCMGLLEAVVKLDLGDCSIATFKIQTDLIKPLEAACKMAGGASNKEAGSGSSKEEATVTMAPTTAPTSSGSLASSNATTTAPAAAVPTPTPTKTSAASAVTVAAGAAVAAVAASLW